MHLINHTFITPELLKDEIKQFSSSSNILIQIFCGKQDKKILQEILDLLYINLPSSIIVGASAAGEIKDGQLFNNSIQISFCFFKKTKLKSFYYSKANKNKGLKAAKEIITSETKACIAFCETFKNNAESFFEGFYSHNDSIIVAGGNAGNNENKEKSFVICDNKILNNGIVLVSLDSNVLSVYPDHSLTWSSIGNEMNVTKCKNNIIYELDNKPIFDVYEHYLGEEITQLLPCEAYEFPLIHVKNKLNIARSIVARTQDKAFVFAGKFQEGDKVSFAIHNETQENDTYEHQKRVGKKPCEVIFLYSCVQKKRFNAQKNISDFKLFNEISKNAGFFTYGEFFTHKKYTHLLNIATTSLSLSENKETKALVLREHDTFKFNTDSAQNHLVTTIQEELSQSVDLLNQYKLALDESSIVSKTNLNGIITYVNDKFCETSGYTKEELIGKNHNIVRHPDTPNGLFLQMWGTLIEGKVWKDTFKNLNKNGSEYYVKAVMLPIFDKNAEIIEYISIRTDITEIFLKDKIIKENEVDKLTQLKNRQALLKLFEKKETQYLLILINLDRFSEINNYFGYHIGDKLLQDFAKRLKEIFASSVFRITADEFAIVSKKRKDWEELLNSVNFKILELENSNFKIEQYDISVNTTSGMAFDKGKDIYSLANIALKEAKEQSKKIVFFNSEKHLKEKIKNNILMIEKIKSAITNDRIVPYFQAIVDNKTKKICKYEALIRLIDEEGKLISPYYFLEHAKKAKLYEALTKIMINKTFEAFKNLDYEFSINLTIQDILSFTTRKYLYSKLEEYQCGKKVILEIVESEGIENFEDIISFINKVKTYGCQIAIDDFGSGYSNFYYLAKLKVDIIKIDGSLIKNINNNKNQRDIVESILLFTKKQNLKTVAEFVENEEIYTEVLDLDVDYSQGYFFNEPQASIST